MHKKRTGLQVMIGLIGMIKPLLGMMMLAIIMGSAGHLVAMFITILGGYGIVTIFQGHASSMLTTLFVVIGICAVSRGILRYLEQASNHYIAFKLLARIRHQVFAKLRTLAPAKLDGAEKGNLISIITSDIELLEVFYAHTISPIAIAIVTSLLLVAFIGQFHFLLGVFALICYVLVGGIIPLINGKLGRQKGQQYRQTFGELNTHVLDNLYGLEDLIQYGQQSVRLNDLDKRTEQIEALGYALKKDENRQRITTDGVILFAGVGIAILAAVLRSQGLLSGTDALIAILALMSSFGPTAALSALSNNLNQTLASGDRVLDLLDEEPIVHDIKNGTDHCDSLIVCENVTFSYEQEKPILKDFSKIFAKNKIHGLLGASGCGKSTLLKLLMRFYEAQEGSIQYGQHSVNHINTSTLRQNIAYVTQDTFLFQDTVANNIRVAHPNASSFDIEEAAKKAAIHEFILSLPKGYETKLSEFGSDLSGGERQRIGLARAFLHDSPIIFLDEPTSNIDSLNEGIILESLVAQKKDKTILLVSHRKSTMGIVDELLSF